MFLNVESLFLVSFNIFFFFFVSSPSSLKICLPNYFIYNLRQSIIRLLDRPERIDVQTIPDHARSSINPLNNRGYEYSWVRIPFCVTRLRFLLVNEPSKRRIDRRGASPSPSFPLPLSLFLSYHSLYSCFMHRPSQGLTLYRSSADRSVTRAMETVG